MNAQKMFRGKNIVVMGLGLHGGGLSTALWLLRHGATIVITDTKTKRELASSLQQLPKTSRVQLVLGGHRLQDFRHADMIVQNPGVPADSVYIREAKKYHIPVVNEVTLFFDACPTPNIIAVTGTKGKSTTSSLLYHLLKTQFGKRVFFGGNIRTTPMLSIVDKLKKDSIVVLELSSWHLELFAEHPCRPHIAIVTNLLDDHLNRYASRNAYFAAKGLIWKWQKKNDVVILNHDNVPSRKWKNKTPSTQVWFSQRELEQNGAYVKNGKFTLRTKGKEQVIAKTGSLRILGDHNQMNALAALLAAQKVGMSAEKMERGLRTFQGVPHRMEKVRIVNEVTYYNDTAATTPDATIAALQSFSEKSILIAGGTDKKLLFGTLARTIRARTKKLILLPGTATEKLKKLLGTFPYTEVKSMVAAVREANTGTKPGDVVLLSPGAASFGLFQHEFDRGDQFIAAVKKLR